MTEDASSLALAHTSQPKTNRTKRSHRKSRFGCTSCKVRKVKCDESRPVCGTCKLRGTTCEYGCAPMRKDFSGETSILPATNSVLDVDEAGTPTIMNDPVVYPPSIDVVDAKLLWFYTSATYKSFSYMDERQKPVNDMLQTVVVQHAFQASFLMDSILEFATLHMQSLGQTSDPDRALVYRVRSFEGYRRAIEVALPQTYGALLANAVLRPMLSTQFFRDPAFKDLYLPEWMMLWCGVAPILQITSTSAIAKTGMSPLLSRPPFDPDADAAAVPKQLLLMVSFIDEDDEDIAELQTYQKSLRPLGSLFVTLKNGINSALLLCIVTWATFVPRRLLELAIARRPRALVILAHYAVFLKLVQDIWWLAGVGERSIRDICHFLGPRWHKYLDLPLSALLIEDGAELSRVMLGSADE